MAIDRESHFERLSFLHPEQGSIITGVVESRNGDLWVNGAQGIVRIPATEIHAAMADPAHAVASFSLQEGDFVGPDIPLFFRNSAHIDPSRRLWFSTLNGVVSVDPDHLAAPRHPPTLSIRSITADGRPLNTNGTLPPGTQYLDVRYFGVDLTRPQNVVYRYRLQGLDTAWQNVGPRAEAIYTHLRPGDYTFQVMASSGNDIWTLPLSSSTFTILPHFYETGWFLVLCALIGALLVWRVICVRVRYASDAIRYVQRNGLKSVFVLPVSYMTRCCRASRACCSLSHSCIQGSLEHESKEALNRALITADRIILEGRDRVNRLRSEHLTNGKLEPSIRELTDDLAVLEKMEFALERTGAQQPLNPEVMDEVYFITREALTNSYRQFWWLPNCSCSELWKRQIQTGMPGQWQGICQAGVGENSRPKATGAFAA